MLGMLGLVPGVDQDVVDEELVQILLENLVHDALEYGGGIR